MLEKILNGLRAENTHSLRLQKKMDTDERVIREALVKVWTRVLERYAAPGAVIPQVEELRKELIRVGADAAVDAVLDEHWFVFSWMIHDKIERKVKEGLSRLDLAQFAQDVKQAQNDRGLFEHLKREIALYVMEGF